MLYNVVGRKKMTDLDLDDLRQLKARGIINDTEFEDKKKALALQTLRREKHSYYFGKNGSIYILLAFVLGAIGIHNFYAGRWKTAFTQLLLGVFSPLFLYLPLIVTSLWALSDIFFVNKDGKGLKFSGSRTLVWCLRLLVTLMFAFAVYRTQFVDFSLPEGMLNEADFSSTAEIM